MIRTIREPARELPVAGHFDVIVAGGGFAGISAALSARRAGAKRVLLIEREYTLGGLATLGLVTIYLPLCDGTGRQVSFGIAEELLRLSISHGAEEEPLPDCWQHDAPREERAKHRFRCQYNAAVFASLADQLLIREGVEILFGTSVCAAAMEDGRIRAVITENKNGRQAYLADSFVDATGDADLCRMTGEATCDYQQGNVMAAWSYATTGGKLSLRQLGFADIPNSEKPNGRIADNDTRERFTGRDAAELSRLIVLSRKWAVDDFLRQGDLAPDHSLVTLPTIPQIRMTRRIKGETEMSLSMDGQHIDESVGIISNWKRVGPAYEVPFASLYGSVPNLYAAGRCMAAEEDMWDVTRVIPCCAVTGEAAGIAAVVGRDVRRVQAVLRERKIPLHISEL